MKNKIIHMNQADFVEVNRQIYRNGDVFCVEINGTECKHLSEYLSDISGKLQFPTEAKSFDVYDDWMTDLSWLDKDNIIIIVYHYADFLRQDLLAKRKIIENFEQSILPWWEVEVCNCVIDGKTKSFLVYLLD